MVVLRYIHYMRPYSNDLRQRVIAAVKAGKQTQVAIATTFGISQSTLEKWWYAWRTKGQATALPHRSGPSRRLQRCESFLRAEVKRAPDVTLEELCTRVAQVHCISVSPSMMCRELERLNLPRKKSRFMTASVKPHG
jgi:transposase